MQRDILDLVELSPKTVDMWSEVVDLAVGVLLRAGQLLNLGDEHCDVRAFAQQDGTLLLSAELSNANITLEVPRGHWNWSNRN